MLLVGTIEVQAERRRKMMRRLIFILTAMALVAALMTFGAAPATAQLTEEERADLREWLERYRITADRLGVEEGEVVPEDFEVSPEDFEVSPEDFEGFWESWAQGREWWSPEWDG
jgi:hypothetical protein